MSHPTVSIRHTCPGDGVRLQELVGGRVVGWCEVIPRGDGACLLEHLWIEPEWIGGVAPRWAGAAFARRQANGGARSR